MSKKPMDAAIEEIDKQMLEKEAKEKKMKPLLDAQLRLIEKDDGLIRWHENKMKDVEQRKQAKLSKMRELLDLAMQSTHSLKNGYTVRPDNKRKVEVTDIGAFMAWLKKNKKPQEQENCHKTTPENPKTTQIQNLLRPEQIKAPHQQTKHKTTPNSNQKTQTHPSHCQRIPYL